MRTQVVGMKRILIVDDFEPGRLVLRENLEMQGYACQEAVNGLEALETIKTKHFDLVITDQTMPIMTGLELTQSLAYKSNGQHPPVILLTGHPTNQLYRKAQQAGVEAFFSKPCNQRDLSLAITRILEPQMRAETPESQEPRQKISLS